MILETYKLLLSELKVTCSTTVYKNLSLIMKIGTTFDKEENRIYNVVNSIGLFDGQVIIKSKPIDTVAFQLDTQRKKYLPKQIQFQLNLTYRTGKLNQKIYPINFNEFITKKKGHYEKEIKITQRLYSFYVVIVARSTTLDTIIQTPTLLTRIRSQKRFDRQGTSPPQTEMKKRYSKYNSPQQQTVIKYTINQNIKITRPQQINSTSKLQPSLLIEQRETSILRERFQQKQSQLSKMEEQKTRDQSSFINRNRIFTSRGRQPITEKLDQYPTKGIITAINNVGEKQKISVLQQKTSQLQQKLEQQQKRNYKLQKQLASLKNKIEHLYHEKTILIRQKQEERLVFQTKDKQQKMRQRRDIQQLRRVYEGQLKEKDERIGKMEKQLKQMRDVESKKLQEMVNQMKQQYELIRQRQIQESSKQINLLSNKIRELQQKLQQTQRQLQEWIQKQKQPKLLTTPHHFVIHRHFLDEESLSQQLNYTQSSSSFVTNKHDNNANNNKINQIQGNNEREQQQVGMNIDENSQQFLRQQELLELMQQQTLTYNNMIAKLQANLLSIQSQYQSQVEKNQQLMKDILRLNQLTIFYEQKQIQKRTIEEIKVVHDEQINQYQLKIKELQGEIETLSRNGKCIRDCAHHFHSCCHIQNNQKIINQNYFPCNCLSRDHHRDQNSNCRAYHQIQINHPQQEPQTIITMTTKQRTKYKITLFPQTQIIYIPPSQFVKATNSKLLGQSSGSQGYYGKNFQLYQKNRQQLLGDSNNMNQQMYKTTGYFGRPLNRLVNNQNHNSSIKLDKNTEQSTYQNEQDQHQQYQVGNNNFSCRNNYSYISNKQQEQQQQYLNLIDQFQGINNKHTNISHTNISNNNISNKNVYNSNKNVYNSNNNNKNRSKSFYIGSQVFDHESDSIIVNKQQNSYINQNGDYVKKSLIQVYQRNRINSIS